jgi:hypothetical protein
MRGHVPLECGSRVVGSRRLRPEPRLGAGSQYDLRPGEASPRDSNGGQQGHPLAVDDNA